MSVSPGESGRPHTHTPSEGSYGTGHLSSAHRDQRSSQKSQSSRTVEQLEAELERLRQAATTDLQNLQHDVVAKNREIGRLKAELAQHAEDQPEAKEAKELLLLWRDTVRHGHRGIDVTLDSDRGRAVIRAVRKRGGDRVRKAILGVQFDPWAMGRTAKQDRAYNDIAKHILADSDRFEAFERLFEAHHPEGSAAKRIQLEIPVTDAQLKEQRIAEAGRRLGERVVAERAAIDVVLGALPGDWRPTRNPDEWEAYCPAHDDHNPSLVIRRNADGMVWIKCWAGCDKESVLDALGLEWRDLWDRAHHDTGALNYGTRPKHEIPAHLRQAMQQLLAREERRAA